MVDRVVDGTDSIRRLLVPRQGKEELDLVAVLGSRRIDGRRVMDCSLCSDLTLFSGCLLVE
jgi:hypothetical protein